MNENPFRSAMVWGVWLLIALVSAFGLKRFHIDNSLDAWVPSNLAGTDIGAYIFVGFETRDVSINAVETALCDLPEISLCITPNSGSTLAMLQTSPQGLVVSNDGHYAGVLCIGLPKIAPPRLTKAVKLALDKLPKQPGSGFAIAGPAAFASALNDYSQRRMPAIITLIVLIGGALMMLVTRSLMQSLQSIGAIMMALVILLGTIGWSGVRADMSMLLIPPMMISMGFSYAAHSAIRRDATRVLMICAFTTILGVIFFSSSGVPSIRSFALWGAFGIAIVWLCVLTLVSPPRTIAKRSGLLKLERRYRQLMYILITRYRWPVILAATAIAAIGPMGSGRLMVNPQPMNYFPSEAHIVRSSASIENNLTGMLSFEAVTRDPATTRAILNDSTIVRTVIDLTLLNSDRLKLGQHVLWCMCNDRDLKKLAPVFIRWRTQGIELESPIAFRGIAAQLLEVRRQMKHIAMISIPSMLIVAAIASALITHNLMSGFAGLIVNLLPISIVLILAELIGVSLQLPTLMVGAIGIGAGIDDTIHILSMRRHCSMAQTLRTCLRPCAGSSMIASIAMGTFVLSPFHPTAQFGLLMAVILIVASICDLVLLPIMLPQRPPNSMAR